MDVDELFGRLEARHRPSHNQGDPFHVLIGTILSQRTRDENTDLAAERLFSAYPTPESLARADVRKVERLIRPAGFYRVKARKVREVARMVHEDHGDEVPDDLERLLELPGVGRKTANCVLVYGFNKPAIPVDTHVHRLSNRLGLVETRTPEETEMELMRTVPRRYWLDLNSLLVHHGRTICRPIGPRCGECQLSDICPSSSTKEVGT